MTKYEILYGVTVDHFPNERENVEEKLRLAKERRNEMWLKGLPKTFEEEETLHELNQAIAWAEKILRDISEEI